MHKTRAFFFVCAGLLCLALSFHFGATSVTAQAPGNPLVAMTVNGFSNPHEYLAVTSNGDAYSSVSGGATWTLRGNVFSGEPTPAQQQTWGAVKSRYRGERGAASLGQDKR